ncbi:MAG: HAD-IC family P-type ATPase [Candidatus Moraniibacteriota bacterium]
MLKVNNENYYKKSVKDILEELNSSEHGLNSAEVSKRFLKYGPNKLKEVKTENLFFIFLRQFQSPLIFILLFAAVVVFLTGESIDGFVILFVLFFNAIIGTIQEGKAQNIFLALKKFIKTSASVIREGKEYIISDEEIVPGDIIILRDGEKIPADARLISVESLQVEEAALTGESSSKFKIVSSIEKDSVQVSDQDNMVFKGTHVISGRGLAVVIATGGDTVIGDIAKKIIGIDEELPLKVEIRRFSRFIIYLVFVIDILLLVTGIFYGHSIKELLTTIVALSVSVIPEGLPIVVTLVLATGVWRMGKRNVLVKKLQAVEALGQTSIIAVDKTGTVTKNELTVKEIYIDGKIFKVKGVGYESVGEVEFNDEVIEPLNHPELLMAGKIAALCSSANVAFDENLKIWKISGDPTEAATLILAEKIGFRRDDLEKEFLKFEEKPFDYELKYHSIVHHDGSDYLLSLIGAPEEILKISEKIWSPLENKILNKKEREKLEKVFLEMSAKGLRVVAFAMKKYEKKTNFFKNISPVFVGFFGIEDSLREEVREAVDHVESSGIKPVMITGDHKITAQKIAEEAGIFKQGDIILEGPEIESMTELKLAEQLEKVSVFARVSPLHKLKIINAYKLAGKTIAMTGDGINDALSLTSADVGVAMGKIGTEVAKEASDIILLDDNFGSIVNGVEEGRNIHVTIKRVILYLFSTALGETLIIVLAMFLGLPIPLLATQLLWLNLVTDGFLDVALAMEPKGEGLLDKKYTQKQTSLIDRLMLIRMFSMAIPMAIGTLIVFNQYFQNDLQKAWTISLTLMAVFQWFNVWNCRSHTKSIFNSNPFSNKFLIGATSLVMVLQIFAVYNPFFQKFLRTVPLEFKEWVYIILISFSIIVIEEIRKLIYRKNNKNKIVIS